MKYLLDTHAWIWLLDAPDELSETASEAINADGLGQACAISNISVWEVARKESLGKLTLSLSARVWLQKACATPGIVKLPVDAEIAWESCHLPASFHRDPADQIIVATARIHGLQLVSRDGRLRDYEHVRTIW